jgi:hypothetical protein
MSWNDFHHREEVLRVVVDTANENRDGVLPMHVAGVTQNFTDELDLVGALLLKWNTRLSGNIERALMRQPMDLEGAVAEAWRTTAEQLPGARMVIDRCAGTPTNPEMERAMNRAHDRESAYLAAAAGLSSGRSTASIEAGRRVERLARTGAALKVQEPERAPEREPGRRPDAPMETLADRIRAVLAARSRKCAIV